MALRELHEGLSPTMPRLSAASGIAVQNLKNRSFRYRWGHFSRFAEKGVADGEDDAGTPGSGLGEGEAMLLAEAAEGTAEERLARVSDMLLREVEAIGLLAQARGKMPDKARIDAVGAMIRLLEKVEEFARAKGGAGEKNRDGEVADVLQRIDGRIEELARAYAKELVAEQRFGAGSGADPR